MNEFAEQPLVSIVVVSYRTGPILAKSIRSVTAQSVPCELVLVDNTEAKEHAEALQGYCSNFDNVNLISGHGNIGFARGCNLGVSVAKGKYILLLNPDCVMETDTVERFIEESEQLDGSWIMGADLRNPDNTLQQGSRRELLTPWLTLVDQLKLYRLAPQHPYFRKFNRHTDPIPGKVSEVPAISGACMFLKKESYVDAGGMDEIYFLHVEDLDYCLRHHLNGGKIYFSPRIKIIHHKSSSHVSQVFTEFHKTRSLCTYFRRHFTGYYPPGFIQVVSLLAICKFMLFSISSLPELLGKAIFPTHDKLVKQQLAQTDENSSHHSHLSP